MKVLFSYDPEEVEKFEQRLEQAEKRAEFFEQAYKKEQAENEKLRQQLKAN